MNLLTRLKQAIEYLEQNQIEYALAGGLVASLYRKQPRATSDIDLAILTADVKKVEELLAALNLDVHPLRKANLEGGPAFAIKRQTTPVYMLCGRSKDEMVGVDFILSNMPWVVQALDRARANQIDFGFGPIFCITVEDLILSKLYSVKNQSTRFMDLDDIRSIFEATDDLDWLYLNHQIKQLHLSIPDVLKPFARGV